MNRGIVIAGPTGVGKTDISIKLAKELNADIISADSAQVYKFLNIGTAKIKEEEMEGIKHYMIDVVEPNNKFSVGDYEKKVSEILKEKEKENKNIILVGGTGLYIDAITDGLSILPSADFELRKNLNKFSNQELFLKLKNLDEEAAKTIHENNRVRLERALEVCILTGEKFSVLSKKNKKNNNYFFKKFALERNRENLYEKINNRVDQMIEEGLVDEVKKLYQKYGEDFKKLNIIGYKEIIDFLDEKNSLERAIYLIKLNTRHYSKRQFTWFKNDKNYTWFDLDNMCQNKIISSMLKCVE